MDGPFGQWMLGRAEMYMLTLRYKYYNKVRATERVHETVRDRRQLLMQCPLITERIYQVKFTVGCSDGRPKAIPLQA